MLDKLKKKFYFAGTRQPNFPSLEKLDYDRYWQEVKEVPCLKGKLAEREIIFQNLIPAGSRVLNFACGLSALGVYLQREKNCLVHACDVSPLAVAAQEKAGVAAFVCDAQKPICLKEKYDYIILSEILEHLPFPEKLLGDLRNFTNYFLISVPNSAFYRYRLGLMFKGRFFTQWRYHPAEHLRFWSYKDFLDWLKALNLEVEKTYAANGLNFLPFLFQEANKNLWAHQIVYQVKA